MARINLKRSPSQTDFSGAMTDISFLLIVFFLISAVFVADKGIFLKLPERDTPPKVLKPNEVIKIAILDPGAYTVDGEEIRFVNLRQILATRVKGLLDPIAVLTVADGIRYQEVLSVLEEARYAGCSGFSVKSTHNNPLGVKIEGE